jgi:hypothetical protein
LAAISGDGYPYGYRKLTSWLKREHGLRINKKKVYRLCKELGILQTQRRLRPRLAKRKVATNREITGINQLWETDIKYGYIAEERRFFFVQTVIDVYDRMVLDYHIGLSCTAEEALSAPLPCQAESVWLYGTVLFPRVTLAISARKQAPVSSVISTTVIGLVNEDATGAITSTIWPMAFLWSLSGPVIVATTALRWRRPVTKRMSTSFMPIPIRLMLVQMPSTLSDIQVPGLSIFRMRLGAKLSTRVFRPQTVTLGQME